ncbi:hypothetical protein N9K35_01675 [Pseudomonadales bacterium]|nr:hypothetical protein [Pseudomonadales bacterium]
MRLAVVVFLLLFLMGCVSKQSVEGSYNRPGWFGYIEDTESGFDNGRSINLIPTYTSEENPKLLLGARWASKFPANTFMLVVDVSEALNFEPSDALTFRVDKEYIALAAVNTDDYGDASKRFVGGDSGLFTTNPVVNVGLKTTKEYWINREQLTALLNSKELFMRVNLINDKYLEGEIEELFGGDERMEFVSAKQALKRFLVRVDGIN